MATKINLYSRHDGLKFNVEEDGFGEDQTVWIRSGRMAGVTISITLNTADRAKLRSVLDQADSIADNNLGKLT